MTTPLLTRDEIGLRPPRRRTPFRATEDICHYAGPSPWAGADTSSPSAFRDSTDHNRCASIWRSFQAYHMDVHGWDDIAYTSGVCPHGVRFEGRGPGIKTAATGDANAFGSATCYIAGDDDPLTDEGKAAYFDEANRLGVPIEHVHHDFMQTSCAGPWFDQWKAEGFAPPGSIVTPPWQPPVVPPPIEYAPGDRLLAVGSTGPDVAYLQGVLGIPADGIFGPQTLTAVVTFQTVHGLLADGLVGPMTWAVALGATPAPPPPPPAPAPDPAPAPGAPPFPLPSGWYFGPRSGPNESVSGYFGFGDSLAVWQERMAERGWALVADGRYGPRTAAVATAFQSEKGLTADGLIGPATWAAAWTAPVT